MNSLEATLAEKLLMYSTNMFYMHAADATKILIIDDEVDICFLLSNLLKKKNFHTQSAFDIHQAKLALVHYTPSIVFLDNHLTDGLGMNFIPYIKQACPEAKIIMITAYDDKESQEEAFDKGVDDFVSKPLRWDILSSAIERVMTKSPIAAG